MNHDTKSEMNPPGYYVKFDSGHYDLTCHIGPLWPERYSNDPAPWPMYSFDRPAHILWNAIGAELFANGWTDDDIKSWLQSKGPRWELDGDLGDRIEALGKDYAARIMKDYSEYKKS